VRIEKLDAFVGGWFIGNFEPAIVKSKDFEVCIKHYKAGESEPIHYQLEAWEVTAIITGDCEIGGQAAGPGDVILLAPLEAASFKALSDCTLVAVKSPSKPSDKVLGIPK
jgi:hypothetical protein